MDNPPVTVIAHPKRRHEAAELAHQVGADAICWDIIGAGGAANHLQAWHWLAGSGHRWGVVLEDDVIPCRDFHRNLRDALTAATTPIVSLYLGRGRPPQHQHAISRAITSAASFVETPGLLSAQGYAMHTSLLAQAPTRGRPWARAIDEHITAWAARRHHRVSTCRVSLVQHRDGPTLIDDHGDGQPRNGRTALMEPDCDPTGAALPEIRRAWLLADEHTRWDETTITL